MDQTAPLRALPRREWLRAGILADCPIRTSPRTSPLGLGTGAGAQPGLTRAGSAEPPWGSAPSRGRSTHVRGKWTRAGLELGQGPEQSVLGAAPARGAWGHSRGSGRAWTAPGGIVGVVRGARGGSVIPGIQIIPPGLGSVISVILPGAGSVIPGILPRVGSVILVLPVILPGDGSLDQ